MYAEKSIFGSQVILKVEIFSSEKLQVFTVNSFWIKPDHSLSLTLT